MLEDPRRHLDALASLHRPAIRISQSGTSRIGHVSVGVTTLQASAHDAITRNAARQSTRCSSADEVLLGRPDVGVLVHAPSQTASGKILFIGRADLAPECNALARQCSPACGQLRSHICGKVKNHMEFLCRILVSQGRRCRRSANT